MLSCDSDGAVIEWDLEEGNATQYLGFHDGICTRIAVSPDASLAVTSSADGRIMIWDLRGGKLIRRYDAHSPILSITLSHDGQYLYFGALHGVITQMRIDNPSLEETLSWIEENRYIPALTCKEREKYHVEPLCDG